jgi:hypothetical protein
MSKKITGFSLDENVVEAMKELAKKDDRTMSNYVNRVLLDHIVKEGFKQKGKNSKLKRRRE